MNKKYLTFLSAILVSTISACGGSSNGEAARQEEQGARNDPAPAPESTPLALDILNEELKSRGANAEFSALSKEVQESVKYYVSIEHKFVKSKVEVDGANMGPVGTLHVLSPDAIKIIEQASTKWTDIYEEFSF